MRLPHEKLIAYQVAVELLAEVRKMRVADLKLRDQVSRAAKSVCLNIAEAVGRCSDADRKRVYAIARGECCETAAAIDIALATGECDATRGRAARATAGRVYALLTGLIRRYDVDMAGPKASHALESGHQNEDEHANATDRENADEDQHESS
ncbi:MAG TPA: four helix bundle protein [Myxococcales bacterium]